MLFVELFSLFGQHVYDMLPGKVWRGAEPLQKSLSIYRDVVLSELLQPDGDHARPAGVTDFPVVTRAGEAGELQADEIGQCIGIVGHGWSM